MRQAGGPQRTPSAAAPDVLDVVEFRGSSAVRGLRRSCHPAWGLEVEVAKQADLGAVVEGLDAHVEHDACDRGVGERRRAAVTLGLGQPGVTE
jgi:hypothetical protein